MVNPIDHSQLTQLYHLEASNHSNSFKIHIFRKCCWKTVGYYNQLLVCVCIPMVSSSQPSIAPYPSCSYWVHNIYDIDIIWYHPLWWSSFTNCSINPHIFMGQTMSKLNCRWVYSSNYLHDMTCQNGSRLDWLVHPMPWACKHWRVCYCRTSLVKLG